MEEPSPADPLPMAAPRRSEAAEVDATLAALLTPGLGRVRWGAAVETFGSAAAAARAGDWSRVHGVGKAAARELPAALAATRAGGAVERERAAAAEAGAEVVLLGELPLALRRIPDPPPLLFVRGRFVPEDALAVAVVGSRACSGYGREQADRFASHAADAGLTVVSGGAYGIDEVAHRAVLRRLELGGRGRTVAVLGSGLGRPYPAVHKPMFEEIVARGGVVCSELPMTAPPARGNFPARNRIVSGLSLGVLVVEAAERSGASITARLAVEEHGRVVMAVPGRVDQKNAAGCHRMIREGATLVSSPAEMLEALGEPGRLLQRELLERGEPGAAGGHAEGDDQSGSLALVTLSDVQRKLVSALPAQGGAGVDALSAATGLAAASLFGELTVLQLRGVVEKGPSGFRRRRASKTTG